MFSPSLVGSPLCALVWVDIPRAGDAGGVNSSCPLQVTDNALVYSTFLIHSPRPAGNLSILRTNRAEVPIECHYPRLVWDGACCCPWCRGPFWQHSCKKVEVLRLRSLLCAPAGSGELAESILTQVPVASWWKLQGCPAHAHLEVEKNSPCRENF